VTLDIHHLLIFDHMRYVIFALLLASFSISVWIGTQVYQLVHERKEKMEDYAEINMVNHELFNMQLWKDKALTIIQKKIRAFEFSDEMYEVLDDQIQSYIQTMHKVYIEDGALSDIIISEVKKSGNLNAFIMKFVEQQVPNIVTELDLRGEIPGLSDQIVSQIKVNEPLIKQYLQQELLRLVLDVSTQTFVDRRSIIYDKYAQSSLLEADTFLKASVDNLDNDISDQILYLILALGVFIILCFVAGKVIGFQLMIGALTIGSIVLLILGVSLPMIDIDARLNSFDFQLFEEPITFDEQIIYYQSKSIVEVTQTLWEGQGWDLKLVGLLVLMFSIVFPFLKLLLSGGYVLTKKISESRLAQNIIFHLGKWSMADVFVVAMFMAYIGFYGIITTQLGSIERNQGGFAIETINYSRLSPGAFFFTAYTVLSIFISILINRHALKKQSEF